jgi:gliding motility-associated-like protein
VPTAFSPNKDGINDWFTVFGGRSVARIVSMDIYDRKGGLAFSVADVPANQEEKGWDGRIGEEEAQSGVFTYKLLLEFASGKVETVTGTVLLLR